MEREGSARSNEGTHKQGTEGSNGDQSCEVTGEVPSQCSDSGNAPTVQGNRLRLFNKVMERSLHRFMEDASFQRFARTFHPFYKKNPQLMENIHKQFVEDLQKSIQEDINKLIVTGDLQCKLDELDKLEKTAKNKTESAWRPTGMPAEDLCSFVMPYYQKQRVYLQRELKKIQQENAALAQKVQAGRQAIAQAEQRIATAMDDWKASASEFQRLASALCPLDAFDV